MYKIDRKSMLEMQQETKNLQYQLKGIGAGVEFHGGFWAEYVYVITPKGPVARILSNGAVFMDKGWYEKQNDAARYLVDEFIKYLQRWMWYEDDIDQQLPEMSIQSFHTACQR